MKTVVDNKPVGVFFAASIAVRDADTGRLIAICPWYHGGYPEGGLYSYATVIKDALNSTPSQRIQDLLEANNRYQQAARDEKARADDLRAALDFTRTERDNYKMAYRALKRATNNPVTCADVARLARNAAKDMSVHNERVIREIKNVCEGL